MTGLLRTFNTLTWILNLQIWGELRTENRISQTDLTTALVLHKPLVFHIPKALVWDKHLCSVLNKNQMQS